MTSIVASGAIEFPEFDICMASLDFINRVNRVTNDME